MKLNIMTNVKGNFINFSQLLKNNNNDSYTVSRRDLVSGFENPEWVSKIGEGGPRTKNTQWLQQQGHDCKSIFVIKVFFTNYLEKNQIEYLDN